MNKVNYDAEMVKQIQSFGQTKPTLLLHACCAPCSTACLERLKDHFHITVFFYNPNIEDDEYLLRKAELIHFISQTGWAEMLDCDHEKEAFYQAIKGLEDEPERGRRCRVCFALRLKKTHDVAESHSFDYFATTLTLSPLKDAELINDIGKSLEANGKVRWLYSDFKKQGGYARSITLSKEYCLYRQNFCGCVFSQRKI
jgi:hypothetical protein